MRTAPAATVLASRREMLLKMVIPNNRIFRVSHPGTLPKVALAPTGSETTDISPIDLLIEGRNPEQPGTPNTSLISPLHKGGMLIPSAVECYGFLPSGPSPPPPPHPPDDQPRLYHNVRNLCTADSNALAGNMGCACEGKALHCPRGTSWEFQLADCCLEQYDCGIGSFSKYLDDAAELAGATINSDVLPWSALTAGDGPNLFQDVPSGVMPIVNSSTGTGPVPGQDSCPGTCTRQCSYRETCSCYASPVNIIFWHSGNCGPARKSIASLTAANAARGMGGRKAKRQEDLTSLNGTAAAPALGSSATADTRMPSLLNGTYGTTNSTIDWNSFPAPCNESYVSYACANSTDGIVYEPIESWLGALLPENATEIPPVPEEWLKVHEISSDPDSNATAKVSRGG